MKEEGLGREKSPGTTITRARSHPALLWGCRGHSHDGGVAAGRGSEPDLFIRANHYQGSLQWGVTHGADDGQ